MAEAVCTEYTTVPCQGYSECIKAERRQYVEYANGRTEVIDMSSDEEGNGDRGSEGGYGKGKNVVTGILGGGGIFIARGVCRRKIAAPASVTVVGNKAQSFHLVELSIKKSLEEYVPVPGLTSIRLSDLKIIRAWERKRPFEIAVEMFADVRKVQCVLFTSFLELEPSAINTIAESLPCPVYPIGPSSALDGDDKIHEEEHREWLDAQPENSVLYVSFGSYIRMPPSQLQEIAMGLRDSGVSFFWVARDKAADVQQMCGDRGLVVPWCEQHKVLCHPSVGGFLSHCGWNSVLEAVYAGVPLLAFPRTWDQLVNARMAADEWKVGIDLRGQKREDGTVTVGRAAISAAVGKLMDSDSGVGQEMRRRAAGLREDSRCAIHEGGSSHRSFTGFLQHLVEGKLNFLHRADDRVQIGGVPVSSPNVSLPNLLQLSRHDALGWWEGLWMEAVRWDGELRWFAGRQLNAITVVGDQVFLKLQPYIQTSVAPRANHKLAYKYYGPFPIVAKINEVAYKLQLPPQATIHPVFHVSLLRRVLNSGGEGFVVL
ncbi:UDP-glycosyltransferase 87A2 [Triticum urartu]|uniref:Glycosyltransferase n=1 Tax=Triticum urartu TaxID=4572 RepID=M7YIZ0_TRIUA|nr:UDP-glycosyltransferase 87A2 [Triticum urartu]